MTSILPKNGNYVTWGFVSSLAILIFSTVAFGYKISESVEQKVQSIQAKVDIVKESRAPTVSVQKLESQVIDLQGTVTLLQGNISEIGRRVEKIENKLDKVEENFLGVKSDMQFVRRVLEQGRNN